MTAETSIPTPKIGNDLIAAYMGYYEKELPEATAKEMALEMIMNHTPKQHLKVYLTWNGIIGYTDRIFEIANGEL